MWKINKYRVCTWLTQNLRAVLGQTLRLLSVVGPACLPPPFARHLVPKNGLSVVRCPARPPPPSRRAAIIPPFVIAARGHRHVHEFHHAGTDVGGRVTDGADSSVAAKWSDRAKTVTFRPLPGWCGCVYKPGWLWPLRMAKRVSKRATRGGERQSTEPPGHRIRAPRPERSVRSVWTRRLVFLALAGPAVRRLGDSAPRWPAGSPAQWQRPRMWICVGPRDPATKPSRGCLRVVELSAIPQLPT